MRGLYAKIAGKTGMTYHEIRTRAMKVATTAAKKLLEEVLGPEAAKKPGEAWFKVLSLVLPTFWSLVKSKFTIPSVEEVLAEVKRRYPAYAEEIRKAFVPVTA